MRPTILLLLSSLLFACSITRAKQPLPDGPAVIINYDSLYLSYGVQGCFALYQQESDSLFLYNPRRCEQGFLPASTYKIPNSLIALETGVLSSPADSIYWDGRKAWNADWNRNHSLASAFRVSCVPCYQQIARKVGKKRMRHWTKAARYGQLDIKAKNIDIFWLAGDSRITPLQQVDFLRRLYREELPFRRENQQAVKQVMLLEEGPGYKLYGKTGWAQPDSRNIGWFVGWVETKTGVYIFANNVENQQAPEGKNQVFQRCRREIVMAVLQREGII